MTDTHTHTHTHTHTLVHTCTHAFVSVSVGAVVTCASACMNQLYVLACVCRCVGGVFGESVFMQRVCVCVCETPVTRRQGDSHRKEVFGSLLVLCGSSVWRFSVSSPSLPSRSSASARLHDPVAHNAPRSKPQRTNITQNT